MNSLPHGFGTHGFGTLLRGGLRWSGLVLGGLLVACAAPTPPLYHWGNYPDQIYGYLKADLPPEQQLDAMERISTEAAGTGQALPPGFRGHMALLMLKLGKDDQARELMRAERETFPESSAFMTFLLKDGNRQAESPSGSPDARNRQEKLNGTKPPREQGAPRRKAGDREQNSRRMGTPP